MNGLTKKEVLLELAKGSKLTADSLLNDYIQLTEEGIVYNSGGTASLNLFFDRDNIRVYEEPQKMVKMYKYAWQGSGGWRDSNYYYLPKNIDTEAGLIQLDCTMIEVPAND